MSTVSTVAAPTFASTRSPATWRRDRIFFTTMPVAMTAVIVAGFAPTYYLKTFYGTPELSWLFHVHGLLFTAWMLLLIVQPALVASRRTDIHRRIGLAGGALVPLMAVAALLVSIDLGRRGAAPPGVPPLTFLVVPFATVIVFPALIGAALYWRRAPEAHKRLMLIGTLELVPAGFGRWAVLAPFGPLGYFGAADLLLVVIVAFDVITRRRVHQATIWGGLFLVASQIGRFVIANTDTWRTFATWLIS